ncbi:MAG TPA: hypothetical protein VJI75_05745 [Candidatus Nanoarchaeia archaeon]|nr:hypothetical protein [Candidatus Nanoarchaeia archaeon]
MMTPLFLSLKENPEENLAEARCEDSADSAQQSSERLLEQEQRYSDNAGVAAFFGMLVADIPTKISEKSLASRKICDLIAEEERSGDGSLNDDPEEVAGGDSGIKRLVKALEDKFGRVKTGLKTGESSGTSGAEYSKPRFAPGREDYSLQTLATPSLKQAKDYVRNNVITEAYRDHYIEESENDSKNVEEGRKERVENNYEKVSEIARASAFTNMFGKSSEQISPSTREEWELLKSFPFYRIMMMLSYQAALS